jgi:guanine deaminase
MSDSPTIPSTALDRAPASAGPAGSAAVATATTAATVTAQPAAVVLEAMLAAVASAKQGVAAGEGGPFGAAVVKDGKVVAVGHNTVLKDGDPTCHAEVNAIRAACAALGTHVLDGCTLVTTAEPCPMCGCAAMWARVDAVVVGVNRACAAEFGFDDALQYDQLALPPAKRIMPYSFGVAEAECRGVFEAWAGRAGVLY